MNIKKVYGDYRHGEISDADLEKLLSAIDSALPYLSASPAFALVYREALRDRDALLGYKRARAE